MAAIHCAYYSYVQLIKHVLCNNCEIDYDRQQQLANEHKKGSHIFLIDAIKSNMFQKSISARDIRSIGNSFYELKRLRKRADYLDEKIIIDNTKNAIKKSKGIINEIAKIYN
jgi:5'-3' exonuclease